MQERFKEAGHGWKALSEDIKAVSIHLHVLSTSSCVLLYTFIMQTLSACVEPIIIQYKGR